MLPRPLHRPPARASRGALSQAGTLIKTGATPPSPVTPRYPHKLHFICFLFTVSLLIKSVITCLRGHGPRFPTSRDRRACSRGSGRAHVGPRSRLFPGGARSVCVHAVGSRLAEAAPPGRGLPLALDLKSETPPLPAARRVSRTIWSKPLIVQMGKLRPSDGWDLPGRLSPGRQHCVYHLRA